jgi:hypothetical protein
MDGPEFDRHVRKLLGQEEHHCVGNEYVHVSVVGDVSDACAGYGAVVGTRGTCEHCVVVEVTVCSLEASLVVFHIYATTSTIPVAKFIPLVRVYHLLSTSPILGQVASFPGVHLLGETFPYRGSNSTTGFPYCDCQRSMGRGL